MKKIHCLLIGSIAVLAMVLCNLFTRPMKRLTPIDLASLFNTPVSSSRFSSHVQPSSSSLNIAGFFLDLPSHYEAYETIYYPQDQITSVEKEVIAILQIEKIFTTGNISIQLHHRFIDWIAYIVTVEGVGIALQEMVPLTDHLGLLVAYEFDYERLPMSLIEAICIKERRKENYQRLTSTLNLYLDIGIDMLEYDSIYDYGFKFTFKHNNYIFGIYDLIQIDFKNK